MIDFVREHTPALSTVLFGVGAALLFELVNVFFRRNSSFLGGRAFFVIYRLTINLVPARFIALRRYRASLAQRYRLIPLPYTHEQLLFSRAYVPLELVESGLQHVYTTDDPILQRYKRILIYGAPGTGKSTLLRKLVSDFAIGRSRAVGNLVPVLLEAQTISFERTPLRDLITGELERNRIPDGSFLSSLWRGGLLLLIDGLDELPGTARNFVSRQLHEILMSYPECGLVVTARSAGVANDLDGTIEKSFEIKPLSEDSVARMLATYWGDSFSVESQHVLVETLRNNPRLLALARVPLFLGAISVLYRNKGEIPQSEGALLTSLTNLLLESNRPRSQYRAIHRRAVLSRIALMLMDGEPWKGDRQNVLAEVARISEQLGFQANVAEDLLQEVVEHTGLLVEASANTYQFRQLLFQEYFAALELADDFEGVMSRLRKDSGHWHEVAKLWCGLARDATPLLQVLTVEDPVLALEGLAEARRVDPETWGAIVNQSKLSLGQPEHGTEDVRVIAALAVLAARDDSRGQDLLHFLEELATGPEHLVRRAAAVRVLALTNLDEAQRFATKTAQDPPLKEVLLQSGAPEAVRLTKGSTRRATREGPFADEAQLSKRTGPQADTHQDPVDLVEVGFDGSSGFLLSQRSDLRLRIENIGARPLEATSITLERTPKYLVDEKRRTSIVSLPPGATQVISYPITVLQPGTTTLQILVNGTLYPRALDIFAVQDNPYLYGTPAKDAFHFFGRQHELQVTLNNIHSPQGTHTMLIGEQRSGKTSLLYQIERGLADSRAYLPLMISLAGIDEDARIALHWFVSELVRALTDREVLSRFRLPSSFEYPTDALRTMEAAIRRCKERNPDFHLVLLVDEGHLSSRAGAVFQEVLREMFTRFAEEIRVVFACYYDFFKETKGTGSPLHNIFEFIFLKPLAGSELLELITSPARRFQYEYQRDAEKTIEQWSGGHPYYCQALCAESFRNTVKSSRRTITHSDVITAVDYLLEKDRGRFEAGYWDALDNDARAVLRCLTEHRPIDRDLLHVTDELEHKCIITSRGQGYGFTSKLFDRWTKELLKRDKAVDHVGT